MFARNYGLIIFPLPQRRRGEPYKILFNRKHPQIVVSFHNPLENEQVSTNFPTFFRFAAVQSPYHSLSTNRPLLLHPPRHCSSHCKYASAYISAKQAKSTVGVIAQLVERRVRNAKVWSSILHGSTIFSAALSFLVIPSVIPRILPVIRSMITVHVEAVIALLQNPKRIKKAVFTIADGFRV